MMVDFEGHSGIVGETQSGKTLLSNVLFQKTGGLYIDIVDLGDVKAERTLTRNSSREVFDKVITRFNHVRYVPSSDEVKRSKEAKWICKRLKKYNKNIYLYVDEIQNWGTSRKNDFDVIAIEGLKHGIHLVWITQRPANVSKTIASQSKSIVFFNISGFEKTYFDNYQIPYDTIVNKFVKQPEYSFVVYTRGEGVSEPYKLTLKK